MQELEALTVQEKIQLAEDLWDSVAKSNAEIEIPQWQRNALDCRKRRFLDNPEKIRERLT